MKATEKQLQVVQFINTKIYKLGLTNQLVDRNW